MARIRQGSLHSEDGDQTVGPHFQKAKYVGMVILHGCIIPKQRKPNCLLLLLSFGRKFNERKKNFITHAKCATSTTE